MLQKVIRVEPIAQGWEVVVEGENKSRGPFETREQAFTEAGRLAQESGQKVTVRDESGGLVREPSAPPDSTPAS